MAEYRRPSTRGHLLSTCPRTVLRVVLACALAVSMLALSACDGSSASDEVIVNGSTTILPIAEIAAEQFMDENPEISVLVSGVGSSAGIETVTRGSSDIGTSSRDLKTEEETLGLVDTPIAYDAIAVIVNPDNPIRELTTEQVRDIFSGRYTNWSELGGPDLPIGLVNRDEASGTREAFNKIVMGDETFDIGAVILPGTGQARAVVTDAPGAVGYISLGFVNDDVKAIVIDGVVPSEEAVVAGTYPVSRILHCFTMGEPTGLVKQYLDYVLSPAIQDTVVRDAGFIPITAKEAFDG
ncbi:MAG: phosphate ABC transporter substrate-binding protein [Coriobacteriia bacterium]|nr:phosphate ABC transporter substrate-binding protein [Coriobacteriia bacterium]MBN2822589.1 phosphate ABC transporter substrate-binding protein [Coriobacteriia bacterium]